MPWQSCWTLVTLRLQVRYSDTADTQSQHSGSVHSFIQSLPQKLFAFTLLVDYSIIALRFHTNVVQIHLRRLYTFSGNRNNRSKAKEHFLITNCISV